MFAFTKFEILAFLRNFLSCPTALFEFRFRFPRWLIQNSYPLICRLFAADMAAQNGALSLDSFNPIFAHLHLHPKCWPALITRDSNASNLRCGDSVGIERSKVTSFVTRNYSAHLQRRHLIPTRMLWALRSTLNCFIVSRVCTRCLLERAKKVGLILIISR